MHRTLRMAQETYSHGEKLKHFRSREEKGVNNTKGRNQEGCMEAAALALGLGS